MTDRFEVRLGDCRERMAEMPDAIVDSIVTDPPYGLSFMGKGWDHGVPGVDFWTEALRIAKPGAHLLAFGGTRTFHRLAVAIEDAGWEIRDCVMWVYGSGFPKSHDVSKAIDKMDAAEEQQRRRYRFTSWVRSTGVTGRQIDDATGTNMGSHYTTAASQPAIMTREHLEDCRHLFGDVPEWVEREADIRSVQSKNFAEREVVGTNPNVERAARIVAASGGGDIAFGAGSLNSNITAPATDAAKQWQGWGTALKPAWEPVIVARKPLVGTVAANVLEHGTGAINVDGCRVEAGRWPANLIHDGSDKVVRLFPANAPGNSNKNLFAKEMSNQVYGKFEERRTGGMGRNDTGSAARFFYCAKASKADRDEGLDAGRNVHPTVKPTDLMRYLCRLVTPPDGLVLDPFCGSGSTGKGALLEGFRFIGIEREEEYAEIARARIAAAVPEQQALPL